MLPGSSIADSRHTTSARAEFVIATANEGKFAEMRALLAPYGLKVTSLLDLGLRPAQEDGLTYRDNAFLKAVSAASASGLPAVADDSGIEVDALGGQPGLFTARWSKEQGGEAQASRALWQLLEARGACRVEERGATVVSALAVSWPDGRTLTAQASLRGTLVWPPRALGRGFYGMFVPQGQHVSVAELMELELGDPACAAAPVSHRALAFRKLLDAGLSECLTADGPHRAVLAD